MFGFEHVSDQRLYFLLEYILYRLMPGNGRFKSVVVDMPTPPLRLEGI